MKKTQKQLKSRYWKKIRVFVLRRDRDRCQICGSKERLQIEHLISRRNSGVFFNIKNLTTLCSRCPLHKTYGTRGVDLRVYQVAISREGKHAIDDMLITAKKPRKYTEEQLDRYITQLEKEYPKDYIYGQRRVS